MQAIGDSSELAQWDKYRAARMRGLNTDVAELKREVGKVTLVDWLTMAVKPTLAEAK